MLKAANQTDTSYMSLAWQNSSPFRQLCPQSSKSSRQHLIVSYRLAYRAYNHASLKEEKHIAPVFTPSPPHSVPAPAHPSTNSTPSHSATRPGKRGMVYEGSHKHTSNQISTRLPPPRTQPITYLPLPVSTPNISKARSHIRVGHSITVNLTQRLS